MNLELIRLGYAVVTTYPPDVPPTPSNCHASYVGHCVIAGIGDWDCASGSGNGPNYLPVTVQVVG